MKCIAIFIFFSILFFLLHRTDAMGVRELEDAKAAFRSWLQHDKHRSFMSLFNFDAMTELPTERSAVQNIIYTMTESAFRIPMTGTMPATPELDDSGDGEIKSPAVPLWHGTTTTRFVQICESLRLVRGPRGLKVGKTVKEGIFTTSSLKKAITYAPASGEYRFVCEILAYRTKSAGQQNVYMLKECWCTLVALILIPAGLYVGQVFKSLEDGVGKPPVIPIPHNLVFTTWESLPEGFWTAYEIIRRKREASRTRSPLHRRRRILDEDL